ncbi:MAG: hypothetical protein ACRBN8_22585 [Nannocystales bacterium]
MRVGGFDPGKFFGYGVVEDGRLVCSGTWELVHAKGEDPGLRYFRLFHRLADLGPVDASMCETKFALKGTGTQNLLVTGGYLATVRTWGVSHQADPMTTIAPSSLKLRTTGHGRASKADMAAWASHRSGQDIRDEHEADAVCAAFLHYDERTQGLADIEWTRS